MRTATKSINLISKRSTFGPGRTDYCYGGTVVCAHEQFCSLCSGSLVFSLPLIFTLLAASISRFLTAAMKFSCLSSNEIRLLCFYITRSSSFSVIHVSEDIKNNVENTRLCCCFFSVKVRVALGFPAKKTSSCIWFAIRVD